MLRLRISTKKHRFTGAEHLSNAGQSQPRLAACGLECHTMVRRDRRQQFIIITAGQCVVKHMGRMSNGGPGGLGLRHIGQHHMRARLRHTHHLAQVTDKTI